MVGSRWLNWPAPGHGTLECCVRDSRSSVRIVRHETCGGAVWQAAHHICLDVCVWCAPPHSQVTARTPRAATPTSYRIVHKLGRILHVPVRRTARCSWCSLKASKDHSWGDDRGSLGRRAGGTTAKGPSCSGLRPVRTRSSTPASHSARLWPAALDKQQRRLKAAAPAIAAARD